MSVLKIVLNGDEMLRRKAKPIKVINKSLLKLLDDMAETLKDADGAGLAAPQVGVSKRVALVDVGDGIIELINPVIIQAFGESTQYEGCLSLPEMWGEVSRAAKVRVEATNRKGKKFYISADGLLARALQHEIDHLDGILFSDMAEELVSTEELERRNEERLERLRQKMAEKETEQQSEAE